MSWRVVVVSSNAKVDYKLDYLVVRTVDEVKRVHLSEVGVLMLESTAISLTTYLLCELMRRKIKVIVCDHQRNPCGELVPTCGCHDGSAKIRQQLRWDKGIRESVWTEIVREKLSRQQGHLAHRGLPQARLLGEYIGQLQYNDSTNREGHGAKVYFNALFGLDFTRTADIPTNAMLNYGYSLVMSVINREIAAAGYLNQLGLAHSNTYNPFNLACDFMEPLRPLVDSVVVDTAPDRFEKEEKIALLQLLNREVRVDGKRQYLLYALHLYCASLFRALQGGDVSEITWVEYEW